MSERIERFFAPLLKGEAKIKELREGTILEAGTGYFDFTASGLAFRAIEERIATILPHYANTHSEVTRHARFMSELYEAARLNLKQSLGLGEEFALFPCGNGATGAIKRFEELLGLYIPPRAKKRLGIASKVAGFPVVIVGPYEHHSNEVSFRETPCEVVRIPLDSSGLIDLEALRIELAKHQGREIIASFSIASNVTGIVIPYREISALVREAGGIVAFDMASSSPYMNVDSSLFDVAFLSPHKLLGGVGSCGLLAMRKSLLDGTIPPTFAGGGTVTYVSRIDHYFREDPEYREEAGTPGVLQLLRAALAYRLRNEVGLEFIRVRAQELCGYLMDGLRAIDRVVIYGDVASERLGRVAINVEGISPYEVCERLSRDYHLETRAGCSCAGPYGHDLLGLRDDGLFPTRPGWVRISGHYSHEREDIERLLQALREIAEN